MRDQRTNLMVLESRALPLIPGHRLESRRPPNSSLLLPLATCIASRSGNELSSFQISPAILSCSRFTGIWREQTTGANPELSRRGGQCGWGACELRPAGLTAGGSSRSDKKSIKIKELYLGV